ncbi:MAG: class I SAM-dependent methyltransferase [Verrucomicrobiota bacterium]|nr:class I SAM-dependent methyltransferase [Verrucomicrobiota bacterium]
MNKQINTAFIKRKEILSKDTDSFRIFDGPGDGNASVFIDTFAGHWLVSYLDKKPADVVGCELPRESLWFKRLDKNDKGSAQCEEGDPAVGQITIKENNVRYLVDLEIGYSQGIFLDQRDNRLEVRLRSSGLRVLNCFAYTCAFSVVAALGGAVSTTSIDLSNSYLQWGKRNFQLNGIDPHHADHYFCKGNVFEWLRQFRKKGRTFGGVVLDPPSFSRAGKSEVFSAEKDYSSLVSAATHLIDRGGWMLASCNHRGISVEKFIGAVEFGIMNCGRRIITFDQKAMPSDFSGDDYLKSCWIEIE